MLKYISKRIIYLIPVLIGIVFLVFTIMYFSPGDPAKLILGDRAPEEQVAALRHELGLDLPYYQQLFNYIKMPYTATSEIPISFVCRFGI